MVLTLSTGRTGLNGTYSRRVANIIYIGNEGIIMVT